MFCSSSFSERDREKNLLNVSGGIGVTVERKRKKRRRKNFQNWKLELTKEDTLTIWISFRKV